MAFPQLAIDTFDEAVREFLNEARTRDLTPKTMLGYTERMKRFGIFLEMNDLDFKQVTRREIRDFIRYCQLRGNQSISINGSLKVLRLFYKFLVEEEVLENNPMDSVKFLKAPHKLKVPLTQPQIQQLIDSILKRRYKGRLKPYTRFFKTRNVCIVLLLYDCALRSGEALTLRSGDVNLNRFTALIHGKGRKERVVVMSQRTAQAVDDYMQVRRKLPGLTLLCNVEGEPLANEFMLSFFQRVSRSVGFRIYAHLLRHTGATHRAMLGMPAFQLQSMLGHSDIKTTMQYVHLANQKELNESYLEFSPMAPKLRNRTQYTPAAKFEEPPIELPQKIHQADPQQEKERIEIPDIPKEPEDDEYGIMQGLRALKKALPATYFKNESRVSRIFDQINRGAGAVQQSKPDEPDGDPQ